MDNIAYMALEHISHEFCRKTIEDGSLLGLAYLHSAISGGKRCLNCPNKKDSATCVIEVKNQLDRILPSSHS